MPMEEKQHPLHQRRLRENAELAATRETCDLQAQWIEALQDPEVVLVGMLRGSIAKLSVRSFLKTHGEVINTEEAQLLEIARLREQVVLLRDRKNSIAHLLHQLAAVQLTCDTLQNQLGQWKANHADVVARNRILRDRPDLPADRIPAVEQLEVLQEKNKALTADNTRLHQLLTGHADVNRDMHEGFLNIGEALGIDVEGLEIGLDGIVSAVVDLVAERDKLKKSAQ